MTVTHIKKFHGRGHRKEQRGGAAKGWEGSETGNTEVET